MFLLSPTRDLHVVGEAAERRAERAVKLATPLVVAPSQPPAVGLSDELTAELRSSKAVRGAGPLLKEFHAGCATSHKPLKKSIGKKQKRGSKMKGARLVQRYKTPWEAPA